MMPGQGPNAYVAERLGNIQHSITVFDAQRRYINAYIAEVGEVFSADDQFEVGGVGWSWVG